MFCVRGAEIGETFLFGGVACFHWKIWDFRLSEIASGELIAQSCLLASRSYR